MAYSSLLKNGADTLLAQGALHLELIQVEWALEKLRYKRIMYLLLFGVPLLVCSLLTTGMVVMMLSWNTSFKTIAASLLVVVYSAGALFALFRLQKETASGNSAFAEFRREFAVDIALLRNRLGA